MATNQISEGRTAFDIGAYQRYDRIPLHFNGALLINGNYHPGAMVDFSLAGALFVTDTDADVADGAVCQVEVHDIIHDPRSSLNGIVIHSEHKVMVIKFTGLSEKQYSTLSRAHAASGSAQKLLWRGVADLLKSIPVGMAAQTRSPERERIPNARGVPQRRKSDRRQSVVRRSHS